MRDCRTAGAQVHILPQTGLPRPKPICTPWLWAISTMVSKWACHQHSPTCNAVQMGHFRFQCQALDACVLWPQQHEERVEVQWEGKGNNCSCKPWQVANKAVRDSASPVFTFAPQFVIIEKHSPKSVAYFSVPQTIYLIYAFCFPNLNWHRVGNTTKVLSTSRELATGRGQMRKQLSMH